jgi:hypothetical protein
MEFPPQFLLERPVVVSAVRFQGKNYERHNKQATIASKLGTTAWINEVGYLVLEGSDGIKFMVPPWEYIVPESQAA